ncbi:MAG TPA: PEP/pyruvate-binding domain-containing protein [Myxococcota bacterium]|jgi:hypothetical protein
MSRPHRAVAGSLLAAGLCALASTSPGEGLPPETARAWILEFERSPKGPFDAVRWFCKDGAVLDPRPGACAAHGGGIQHGRWSPHAITLREGGYQVANLLSELQPGDFTGPRAQHEVLAQVLLERFLIGADDGWIFRGARSYRGALQAEDEEAGARRLVLAMLADPGWLGTERFLLLRETVRLLPLQADPRSAARVRQIALELAARDPGFATLRAKIHNAPDSGDAARVRAYAAQPGRPIPVAQYEALAASIDTLYQARASSQALRDLAARETGAALAPKLRAHADALASASDPAARFERGSLALADLRDALAAPGSPEQRLARLEVSLAVETEVFAAGSQLATQLGARSRREQLGCLETGAAALYGAGFASARQRRTLAESVARASAGNEVPLGLLRGELRQLARAPEWAARALAFHFALAEERYLALEPLTVLYAQDRLRGSPLLFYGAVVDSLARDTDQLAGVEHELFGVRVGSGLRALNPGLARGPLLVPDPRDPLAGVVAGGIPLLPETISDLPAVAGILTRGEGSSLSHVQLLARNLGIPNVVVGEERVPAVEARAGKPVVLAVSPGGVVQLDEYGPRFERIFGEAEKPDDRVVIRADLKKLDLAQTDFVPLERLRTSDSGRVSGPKGANLGELRAVFGSRVPDGFVIPFGAFRRLLDQELEPGGPPVFDWMKQQYAAIAKLSSRPAEQARAVSAFLTRLREWIEHADPGPAFREQLTRTLAERFGPDGTYGVFVRSDTNVEDLPGFTGAGLNLTVSNVVGAQQVLEAIRLVWASPFTERAYGWRQAHMEQPEYVFPAVVVQRSFPSEKSGVMVSADVTAGEPGWITVAVNEGVSGAVDGQAAESLRVSTATGEVRLLAQATAPLRNALAPRGGVAREPASGSEQVLTPDEIAQLVALAEELPSKVATLRAPDGSTLPADVEFGFRGGQLTLLQIRPFVESRAAQRNDYLLSLDAGARERASQRVPLDASPGGRAR